MIISTLFVPRATDPDSFIVNGCHEGWMYKIGLGTCWGSFYQYNVRDDYKITHISLHNHVEQ